MRLTLVEISEKLGVEKDIARGMVKFLVEKSLCLQMGERRNERGAPEKVYVFVGNYEEVLAGMLRSARLA